MSRDPRYDILFEPVQIGPVTAKNRFYQVPHCNGGGYRDPSAAAEMRRVKSEGGWGVIFTEQTEMHHTSEIAPYIELRLWDDEDIPFVAKMADAAHEHGALAGTELTYAGINGPNLYTKEVPLAPTAMPIRTYTADPVNARAMTKKDIRDLRRWHRNACLRAKIAGFDLISLYAAHGHGIFQHFLSTATNHRSDEYGGSLENRARLLREVIEECKDAVGDSCGIVLRLSLHETLGELGFANSEVRDLVEMHAELPDMWDLAHGTWSECSGPSRFSDEASQQELVEGIKALTPKPVVGVGRFTSPDVMAKQIRTGILDMIGCARPSIADPFIPLKIDQGRVEDIRECIGCNICITGDMTMSSGRCTQNPTFMEEWRKGWHPEKFEARGESETLLVVGAGPAGLEAARVAGMRGYQVVLAEAGNELGGRVARECKLPGLATWGRVADYRQYQLSQMANVDIYFENELSADDILEFGFENVVRQDAVGQSGPVRRRPLLHGRRDRRAAGRKRLPGNPDYAVGLRFGLERQYAGAGVRACAPGETGRDHRTQPRAQEHRGRAGGQRMRLLRRRRNHGRRCCRHGRLACRQRFDLERAVGARGRVASERHQVDPADRRRRVAGADRVGHLCRAPLRARTGPARYRRCVTVSPRADAYQK
jgi:dimethylamine/trimethylamine dehydrogenase